MFWAALVAALFLSACGGSSSSTPVSGPIVPATPRAGLHMGYYWGCSEYLIEQADHVDVWWAAGGGAGGGCANAADSIAWHLRVAAELQQARGAGVKNIVVMLPTVDVSQLRFEFTRLSEGGYFSGWDSITLYPLDEPGSAQGGRRTDAEVVDAVTRLKQLTLDVPGLVGAHMGVFYGCSDPKPGIKAYDRVGCFRYGSDGCARLERDYADLRQQLSFGARLWMIPGGADIGSEGRQDPACWASYAHRNADVWGVIGFLWQSVQGDPPLRGIRLNTVLRKLYCETGRVILKPDEVPRC